jgi:predicted transcriptional regulator of viral defense system
MRSTADHAQEVLRLAGKGGWVRTRDLVDAAIPRVVLTRMVANGQLQRAARGLYRLPGAPASEHEGLLTVAQKVPQAVICLLSALQFHGLTTQLPWQVWIAMPRGSHTPRIDHPPLRMIQFTGDAFDHGIETHEVAGGTLRVYSVAKTIADCFKHRNKIGLDVALEALKEVITQRKASFDDLWRSAKVCRVANLMRPYMEALT